MYTRPFALSVLKWYLIHTGLWCSFESRWLPLLITSTISLNTPRWHTIFLVKHNTLSQWWEDTLIHSHKQEDRDAQMSMCDMNYVHLCMDTDQYTHTLMKYLPFNETLCFTSFFVCWWRAWACWQTVRLAGRGLKHVYSSHGLPTSSESLVTRRSL